VLSKIINKVLYFLKYIEKVFDDMLIVKFKYKF